jgi:hypothetical protein
MADGNGAFDWGSLGEARWRELGESAGASELQIKFAAARFGGATATGAARLAGYSGDKDSLRRAGYAAGRSTAVATFLNSLRSTRRLTRKLPARKLTPNWQSSFARRMLAFH